MSQRLGPYGRDAYEDHNMLTACWKGVTHQAWFQGSWSDIETRCGLRFVGTNDQLQSAEDRRIDCMLCLDEIAETTALEVTRAERRRRR